MGSVWVTILTHSREVITVEELSQMKARSSPAGQKRLSKVGDAGGESIYLSSLRPSDRSMGKRIPPLRRTSVGEVVRLQNRLHSGFCLRELGSKLADAPVEIGR